MVHSKAEMLLILFVLKLSKILARSSVKIVFFYSKDHNGKHITPTLINKLSSASADFLVKLEMYNDMTMRKNPWKWFEFFMSVNCL